MSYLTQSEDKLWAAVVAGLEDEGFDYNPLTTTRSEYLAAALGTPNANLTKSFAHLLADLNTSYGGSLSYLTSSVAHLFDDLVTNIGGGAALVVNGVTVGDAGTGFYSGYKLAAGDDFNAAPSRWSGRNLTGKYAHSALAYGFRGTNPGQDHHMFIDPAYRGARSESPTDLGYDGVAVANSILTLTATAPAAPLLAYLPTTYTSGNGDGSNRPRLVSGSLKTAPHFMLSAKADFILEAKVRFPAAVARGYFPSFWNTTFFWPDFGEIDVMEDAKDAGGANTSVAHLHVSNSDGAGDTSTTIATVAETTVFVHYVCVKHGTTIDIYDDHTTPGALALVGTYTNARVARLRGAHDVRLDLAVNTTWDTSTFTSGDWPQIVEFDWWRAWVPTAAGANSAVNILPAINVAPGGSWVTTLPSLVTLYGAGPPAGLEQVSAAWDNFDAPGMATRDSTTKLPTSMTVNLGTRAVTGTVPTTEGGCMPIVLTYAYDDGTPARRVMQPYNVAPAVQAALFANFTVIPGGAVSKTIAYTDFHSGNLGPHTYHVTHDGGVWLVVGGQDTGTVTLTGTAPTSAPVVTVTIVATNSIGQTTSVQRTATISAEYTGWTGPGWFDASDTSTITAASNHVSAMSNKRSGGGNLTYAGTANLLDSGVATQNSLNALRLTRDVTTNVSEPRLEASSAATISTMFQGDDKPYTVIFAYKPTDANAGFLWSASDRLADAANAQVIALVRRTTPNSSVRRQLLNATPNDVNFGAGEASGTPVIVAIKHTGTAVSVWETSLTKSVDASAQDVTTFNNALTFRLFAAETSGASDPKINQVQCNLDFYECVVDSSARTDVEIQQAITDIAAKWAITLS